MTEKPEGKVMTPKEFMALQKKPMAEVIKKEVTKTKPKKARKKEKKPKKKKVKMEDIIEMRCYIKYNLFYGQPKAIIRKALIDSGWTAEEVDKEFAKVKMPKGVMVSPPTKPMAKLMAPVKKVIAKTAQTLTPKVEEEIPVPLPPQARK